MELLEIILIALACPLALPLVTEESEESNADIKADM